MSGVPHMFTNTRAIAVHRSAANALVPTGDIAASAGAALAARPCLPQLTGVVQLIAFVGHWGARDHLRMR